MQHNDNPDPKKSGHALVNVRRSTHDMIKDLAKLERRSMCEIVAIAIEEHYDRVMKELAP